MADKDDGAEHHGNDANDDGQSAKNIAFALLRATGIGGEIEKGAENDHGSEPNEALGGELLGEGGEFAGTRRTGEEGSVFIAQVDAFCGTRLGGSGGRHCGNK